MKDQVTVPITLVPGEYLISVVGGTTPRARIWKHDRSGRCEGPGGSIRRPSLVDIFRDLTIKAEIEEGIWPGLAPSQKP